MACKFIREVRCDCCGKDIADLFAGYRVIRLGGLNYDICGECDLRLKDEILNMEKFIIRKMFDNTEGRVPDDEL